MTNYTIRSPSPPQLKPLIQARSLCITAMLFYRISIIKHSIQWLTKFREPIISSSCGLANVLLLYKNVSRGFSHHRDMQRHLTNAYECTGLSPCTLICTLELICSPLWNIFKINYSFLKFIHVVIMCCQNYSHYFQ